MSGPLRHLSSLDGCRALSIVICIMVLIGTVSYSLYIWHVLFLTKFSGMHTNSVLLSWQFCYVGAFATARVSCFLMERPLLRLRNRFRRVDDRRAATPVPI